MIAATSVMLVSQGVAVADPLTDPLYKFFGTVSDPIGRGVAIASVSDGSKSVNATTSGTYELGERDINKTFRLTASKTGMDSVSKDVNVVAPLDTQVDFTLQYRTAASIARRYLSTLTGGTATSLTITTYAPNPGVPGQTGGASCVTVNDSGTGTTTDASYVSTGTDGVSTWAWALSLAAGTPERSGTLTVHTADCATGTVLARDASATYVVDNTPPAIRNVFPADATMSAFGGGQQAGASFRDSGGAGVDSSTIHVTVTDTVTGQTRNYAGGQVSYNSSTGQATAGPMSLSSDTRYRVDISVADRAGNSTSFGHRAGVGGFTTVSATLPAVTVRVPHVDCTLGSTDLTTQTRSVSCTGVKLNVDASSVTLSQVTHAGYGFRNLNAPLTGVQLVLVQPTGNTVKNPYGGTKFTTLKFGTTSTSTTPVTMSTPSAVLDLDNVNQQVQAPLATSAYLVLGDTGVAAGLQGCAGSGGVAGAVYCTSDPLLSAVNVVVKSGQDGATVAAAQAAQFGFDVVGSGATGYGAVIPDAQIGSVRADSRVLEVSRDLPFSFAIPAAELAKNDITNTPLGQQAAANNNSSLLLGIGTCTSTVRTFNMATAAGLPSTGEAATLVWPVDVPLTDVVVQPTGGGGFTIQYGGLSVPTSQTSSSSSCDGGDWQWRAGGCSSGDYNGTHYNDCRSIYWLANDNYADADFYSADQKTSAKGLGGRYIRYVGGETKPSQGAQVMSAIDYAPYYDIYGQCNNYTVSVEAGGVSLSSERYYLCDRWDAEIYGNAWSSNIWRGDRPGGVDYGAEHLAAVRIPTSGGQGTQYIGWTYTVQACASYAYWAC